METNNIYNFDLHELFEKIRVNEVLDYASTLKERGWKVSARELKSRIFRENPTQSLINLMDLLKKYNAHFTFFVVGKTAKDHPQIIKEILDNGHEIGAHGYLHSRMDRMTEDQVKRDLTQEIDLFQNKFHYSLKGFRAPYLKVSKILLDTVKQLGFSWSSSKFQDQDFPQTTRSLQEYPIIIDDWDILIRQGLPLDTYFQQCTHLARPHAVYLMHPIRIGQKKFLPYLEQYLATTSQNYQFTTISNLSNNSIALTGDIGELSWMDIFKRIL